MLTVSPKAQYLSVHGADVEDYRKMVRSRTFTVGAMYAMSALSMNNLSQEQLHGARAFLDTMLNLCEPPEPPKTIPAKELKHA
jgi:hypothetical protein